MCIAFSNMQQTTDIVRCNAAAKRNYLFFVFLVLFLRFVFARSPTSLRVQTFRFSPLYASFLRLLFDNFLDYFQARIGKTRTFEEKRIKRENTLNFKQNLK